MSTARPSENSVEPTAGNGAFYQQPTRAGLGSIQALSGTENDVGEADSVNRETLRAALGGL
jgi:hypothetical protein